MTWLRNLKPGDEVLFYDKGSTYGGDIMPIKQVFPSGFLKEGKDLSGMYLVEVDGRFFDDQGRQMNGENNPFSRPQYEIRPVTQADRDSAEKRDLAVEILEQQNLASWERFTLQELHAIHEKLWK